MLAENDLEPLVLADGTVIDPVTGKGKRNRPAFVEVPSGSEAQQLVVKSRKTVAELPMPPAQMSGVALVAFYALFGLPSKEIALALDSRLSIAQIEEIKSSEVYKDFMSSVKENVVESSKDAVRDKFQRYAVGAAERVIELANSDNDVLAFKASQDVLDRAGFRPADTVEHRHAMEGGLNIVITHRKEDQSVPFIDVTPEDISYANGS